MEAYSMLRRLAVATVIIGLHGFVYAGDYSFASRTETLFLNRELGWRSSEHRPCHT